jgi:hypothetical protein
MTALKITGLALQAGIARNNMSNDVMRTRVSTLGILLL